LKEKSECSIDRSSDTNEMERRVELVFLFKEKRKGKNDILLLFNFLSSAQRRVRQARTPPDQSPSLTRELLHPLSHQPPSLKRTGEARARW
jgi:hypothetical protein